MKHFEGRVAAITGAGSGIGRALATDLARRGAQLALSDVDEVGLAETVRQCQTTGVKVTSLRVDVADRHAVEAWADQVVADHGKVNLIFNNAGVALGATVEGMSYEDFEWLMNIDFWGVVHGTKAFLPHLRAAGEGHIVNISSVFGLISVPAQSAYNSAKFAVRGFTDALRMELDVADCGVSATTIHPGGIKTNIARNSRMDESVLAFAGTAQAPAERFESSAKTSPESAARQILAAVEHDRHRALIGADAKLIDLVSRLPGRLYQSFLVATVLRNADSPERADGGLLPAERARSQHQSALGRLSARLASREMPVRPNEVRPARRRDRRRSAPRAGGRSPRPGGGSLTGGRLIR